MHVSYFQKTDLSTICKIDGISIFPIQYYKLMEKLRHEVNEMLIFLFIAKRINSFKSFSLNTIDSPTNTKM